MATQLPQQTNTTHTSSDLRCTICGTALDAHTHESACKHRINSIRFAELFWDEA